MKDFLIDSLALIGIGVVVGAVLVGGLAAFGHLEPTPLVP